MSTTPTTADLKREAKKLGADVYIRKPGRQWMCDVTAPDGYTWACEPGLTTLVAPDWHDAAERAIAIADVLERMSYGLDEDDDE